MTTKRAGTKRKVDEVTSAVAPPGGVSPTGEGARVPADADRKKIRRAGHAPNDPDAADGKPAAWRRRRAEYVRLMTAVKRQLAEFHDDVRAMQREAMFPCGEDETDGGSHIAGRLASHDGTDELDRINDITLLATRAYNREVSILRRRFTPPPARVAVFGTNDSTQLGVGEDHIGDVIRPRLLQNLTAAGIIQVAAGGLHNVALAEDGLVYTWGNDDTGALGRDGSGYVPGVVDWFRALSSDGRGEVIHRVSAGDTQTLCAGLSGKVYAFGTLMGRGGGEWRDLKEGFKVDAFNTNEMLKTAVVGCHKRPVVVVGIDDAVDVKCGASFNAALCRDGKVLTWGLNRCGELARGPVPEYAVTIGEGMQFNYSTLVQHHMTPLPATFAGGLKRTIESVACGAYHLLVTTCPGQDGDGRVATGTRVYSSGLNQYGQLGLGDEEARHFLTRVVALDDADVRSVAAGQHHSVALDGGGHVMAFGRGDSGQLGVTAGKPEVLYSENLPVRVEIPTGADGGGDDGGVTKDPVTQIACGDTHTLAVTEGGAIYTWGFGESCALGHGSSEDEYRPRRVDVAKGLRGAGRKEEEAMSRRYAFEAGEDIEMGDAVLEQDEEAEQEHEEVGDNPSVKVVQASCGGQHTVILCSA